MGQLAQSELQKVRNCKSESVRRKISRPVVLLRYAVLRCYIPVLSTRSVHKLKKYLDRVGQIGSSSGKSKLNSLPGEDRTLVSEKRTSRLSKFMILLHRKKRGFGS